LTRRRYDPDKVREWFEARKAKARAIQERKERAIQERKERLSASNAIRVSLAEEVARLSWQLVNGRSTVRRLLRTHTEDELRRLRDWWRGVEAAS
jgi:hypothetical protein